MILQALVKYYEMMAAEDKLPNKATAPGKSLMRWNSLGRGSSAASRP